MKRLSIIFLGLITLINLSAFSSHYECNDKIYYSNLVTIVDADLHEQDYVDRSLIILSFIDALTFLQQSYCESSISSQVLNSYISNNLSTGINDLGTTSYIHSNNSTLNVVQNYNPTSLGVSVSGSSSYWENVRDPLVP